MLKGRTLLWKSAKDVLIHLQQCMYWHSPAALIGSSIVLIASTFLGSSFYPVLSMIRPHHLTSFLYNTAFFAERYELCFLHIWKNLSKWRSSCASVLVCKVNLFIFEPVACFMLSNNDGIVDWKYTQTVLVQVGLVLIQMSLEVQLCCMLHSILGRKNITSNSNRRQEMQNVCFV